MRLFLAIALLLAATTARAECVGGVCRFQKGEPVKNIIKAPLVVARAVVAVPVKATAYIVREVRPVRRTLRLCGRVVTLRGPLVSRMRHNRRCH